MVLMTMFSLLYVPLLFACSNTQSWVLEVIKAKGKLVVALNPEFAHLNTRNWSMGKNQIVLDVYCAIHVKELGVEV